MKQSTQDTTAALEAAQEEFAQKAWDQKSTEIDLKISQIEEEIKAVQIELTSTSAHSESRVKIDVLKGDLTKKTQARNVVISSTATKFKDLVGQDLTPTSTDSQINVLYRRKQEDLEEAERLLDGTSKEITQFEAKLNTCKEQLKDKKKEKHVAYGKVMEICGDKVEEFPDVLKAYEDRVSELKKWVGG